MTTLTFSAFQQQTLKQLPSEVSLTSKDGKVQTRCLYNLLAINLEGKKEVIGYYVGDHERASFGWRCSPT